MTSQTPSVKQVCTSPRVSKGGTLKLRPATALAYARAWALFLTLLITATTFAQSSDQNFPTHVTTNEINGRIAARKLGDARLTTYFYLFEGAQGDIFINVATTNFSGDIDVYAADSMKPLTKMVMYADTGSSETGRLIYLRQPARLLLRIEGRTPNDDAATFRIKFGGSFVALAPETYDTAPKVKRESVESRKSEPPTSVGGQSENSTEMSTVSEEQKPKTEDQKPASENTVYENKSAKVTVKPIEPPVKKTTKATKGGNPSGSAASSANSTAAQKPKTENQKPPPVSDPLANVNLVVVFKDGSVMTRPMTEISRFSFSGGTLTVVEKTGTIKRYQMTNIIKVTIE